MDCAKATVAAAGLALRYLDKFLWIEVSWLAAKTSGGGGAEKGCSLAFLTDLYLVNFVSGSPLAVVCTLVAIFPCLKKLLCDGS